MLEKDYYTLPEVAADLGCTVEDVIHQALHDRIRLGIRVRGEVLYGMDADLHTIGVYLVTGVLSFPMENSLFPDITNALLPEPDYPPDIYEAAWEVDGDIPPPFWEWAQGRGWDHPETDHSRIERFGVGFTGTDESGTPIFDSRAIVPARLVIHAAERERLLRDHAEPAVTDSEAPEVDTAAIAGKTIKVPVRQDDLTCELIEILEPMTRTGESIAPATVMPKLQARAGSDRSCIKKAGPNWVEWLNSRTGTTKKLDMEALDKRLRRLLADKGR